MALHIINEMNDISLLRPCKPHTLHLRNSAMSDPLKKGKINQLFMDARGNAVSPTQFCSLSSHEGNLIPCMHMRHC